MAQRWLAGPPLDFGALRTELGVPGEFSSEAEQQGEAAAKQWHSSASDRTDIEFITVDPAGSKDLDQALHIAADGDGYLVSYAIADIAAFIEPGSTLDAETHQRGETFYFPDARVPLHPPVLSEGAASLLPAEVRPAVLWQICLDSQGHPVSTSVERALVRSREQWDYATLQQACDAGAAPPAARLLPQVGLLRQQLARQRHALALDLPEQEVVPRGDGWALELRASLSIEDANAEISLLTGMCAAQLMLSGGIGILRTLPPPSTAAVEALRRIAPALGVSWPAGAPPGDVLATLDSASPKHAAFIDHAVSLLRGAAYVAFDKTPPSQPSHSGIGAAYAHVTAPLRRLVDRYGSEVCLALHSGQPIPQWVRNGLTSLPAFMERADRLAHQADRAVVDVTEAFLLQDRVGQLFSAVVLAADDKGGTIAVEEPAVRAKCEGVDLPVGQAITVTLKAADVATRSVTFVRV
jgi:exoribonuclease R